MSLLDKIQSPSDLKKLDHRELELLCAEIRQFLIDQVSKTGGHLSSNLGVIELTVAMHRGLQSPCDQILFDVGHQCYTHKLLTGRRAGFDSLRHEGGLSGFPQPRESEHDIMIAGHGSAALSAAVGLARAKKLKEEPGLVVVVVGDGAFTGGMAYEGMNNIDALDNLVIVLNDNSQSISKSVGAVARYLTQLRTSPKYFKAKKEVKNVLDNTPLIGSNVKKWLRSLKTKLRKSLYHTTFFEELGLRYIGPIDGHDIPVLCNLFEQIRQYHKPILLHVITKKGKGFTLAERNPGAFHGVSAFDAEHISDPDMTPSNSFSTVFGKTLTQAAQEDKRICAITAAMKYGTGLQYFKKAHQPRFFDVGMAEEHAVTFAAGLAAGGMRPVVALYSTFLQRAYDQIIHDVMLAEQNVLLAVDRAGLVEGDGETHQGIYDAAFLSQQPKLLVASPANYAETEVWLKKLLKMNGPRAIRYPRGAEPEALSNLKCSGKPWDLWPGSSSPKAAILTYGILATEALAAQQELEKKNIAVDIAKMVQINPLPEDLVQALLIYPIILFVEDTIQQGGVGEHLSAQLIQAGYQGVFIHRGITDICVDHTHLKGLRQNAGLDAQSIVQQLEAAWEKK